MITTMNRGMNDLATTEFTVDLQLTVSDRDTVTELMKHRIEPARENRQAQVGVFVFSRKSAPENLEPLSRWGKDVIVVWDADDVQTDVPFKTAISLARMIAVQERAVSDEANADLSEMQSAIDAMVRDVVLLDEIAKCATAAQNHCEKIVSKSGVLKKRIDAGLNQLQEHVQSLVDHGLKK